MIIYLYATQVVFIALTPLALSCPRLAIFWPLLFIAVQVLLGWQTAGRDLEQAGPAGFIGRGSGPTAGIISALVDFAGYSRGIITPEAFDFTAQVWYSPFAPLFALLPRVQYDSVPLYFLVTLLLPFIIAPLPMCGLLLRRIHAGTQAARTP